MAEDDPQWKNWYQFMKKAVLPRSLCSKYATNFTDNDVKVDQLTEGVEDVFVFLKRVGVDKEGHSMRIRTEARKLGCNSARNEFVELLKIDEDETRVGGGENTLEEEDGRRGEDEGSNMVVGEDEEEPSEEIGDSSMGEDSPSPVTVRQACNHGPSEICLNCVFCNKHLNLKSLPRHIHNQHQIQTVPVTNKRTSNSSTLSPAPVAGSQFSSSVESPDDEESDEDASAIVPPLAAPSGLSSSRKNISGTVQGMVKATGKDAGWKLLNVKVNTKKKPVKKVRVTREVEPLTLLVKKVVLKDQSGIEPFSQKKAYQTGKKLKKAQWLVVDPKTKSSQKAYKTPTKENELAPAKYLLKKAVTAPDFVTGTSRFGRERKKKKLQSY